MDEKEIEKRNKKLLQKELDESCVKLEKDNSFAKLKKKRKTRKSWE